MSSTIGVRSCPKSLVTRISRVASRKGPRRYGQRHQVTVFSNLLKIDSCINRLIAEGLLIKGRSRTQAWAGQYVVQNMATAWLDHAINHGPISWDVHLLKLCMVVLQSSV
jgi:hypothetical protein